MTHPTRPLIGPKPLHYVNSVRTDIRELFVASAFSTICVAAVEPASPHRPAASRRP